MYNRSKFNALEFFVPIYEYQCNGCGHLFDVMQKVSDVPETICPKCNQEAVIRLVSAPGFQLKGTGWYVTDFKDKPANVSETKATDAPTNKSAEATTTPSTTVESKDTKKGTVT